MAQWASECMDDLFDYLGLEPDLESLEDVKKVKPKKAAVKTSATSSKDTKKETKKAEKKDTVNFPVKVVTGYSETVTYQKTDFEKEEVTPKEVFDKFTSEQPAFPKSLCGYYAKRKDTVVVYVRKSYASEKAAIKADKDTKYVLGGTNLDLSAFMSDAECELNGATLIEAFKKEYPKYGAVKLCHSASDNTVIPCFTENKLYGNVDLPVEVVFWGHESFTVNANNVSESVETDSSEEEEDDAEADASEAVKESTVANAETGSISANALLGIVETHFPEVKGMIDVCYNKDTKTAIVVMKESSTFTPEKKEKVFPNPNPNDFKPMYIAKRIRYNKKKNFSSLKYPWNYRK